MKRSHSKTGARQGSEEMPPPWRQPDVYERLHRELMNPPPEEDLRPIKVRRHGSKIMSVLRSLRNSVSNASTTEQTPYSPPPNSPVGLGRRFSAALLKQQLEPTIVHRAEFKSRPSLISIDKSVLEITPEESPPTSGESSSNSGKSSAPPRPGDSTGKTSFNSKFSVKSKVPSQPSQHSSENKNVVSKYSSVETGSNESSLAPIAEVDNVDEAFAPEPVPTFITVEKAASAKVFLECHYNTLTSSELSARSLRRRQLEEFLYYDAALSPAEREDMRLALIKRESQHLRETRVMKGRALSAANCKDITASKYEIVKVLGKGSFGVVRLVREKLEDSSSQESGKRKEIYAMKVIRKSDMLRNSQEGHLKAERDFLVAAENARWVVPLIASFQDFNNLYLVMDYMPGGDFLGLLIRDNVLSEPVTKWYIAEMILCIEEAHALRWIHRDIKPDNFLISASGHLKISDFGLAFDGHWSHDQAYFNNHRYSLLTKLGINVDGDSIDKKEGRSVAAAMKFAHVMMGGKDRHERSPSNSNEQEGILNWRNRHSNRTFARSVVGTSQYMAPEVIRGELYDARCDWWSVAIILYECLYGHTPFLAEEGGRQQTKMNILNHKSTFTFPHKPLVSRRCQDLIKLMIQEKDSRLCSKAYKLKEQPSGSQHVQDYAGRYVYPNDAEDIKAHRWFKDIQWERLHQMIPPFVPNIKSIDDTHYFDEEEPISDFSESVTGPPPTSDDISDALKPFNREIQILAKGYIERPHDSIRLRKVEKEIDQFAMSDEQKDYLKAFVKHYGRKEKKRPRDRLLRDKTTAPKVLELRKKGAFLGYTYRRFKPYNNIIKMGSVSRPVGFPTGSGRRTVWHRARLSIH